MQANRISGLQNRAATDVSSPQPNTKQRLDPYANSGFEQRAGNHDLSALNPQKQQAAQDAAKAAADSKPRSEQHRFADGTLVTLPRPSLLNENTMERVFGRLSPEKRAELGRNLTAAGGSALKVVGTQTEAAQSELNNIYDTFGNDWMGAADANEADKSEITASVLHAVEQNIYNYFLGVKEKQEAASDVRADLAELNEMLADWPEGEEQSFTYNDVTFDDDGNMSVQQVTVQLDKAKAEALAGELSGKIQGMGDMSGMEQFQLQKMVQDYQQAVTTLSNIIKNQDEQLRGVAQNVRA